MYPSAQGSRQLAYAPTPSIPRSALSSATINLDEEVKLFDNAADQYELESLAEIYGIIYALDGIERAYLKDSISEDTYTRECSKLLKQYKSFLADERVANRFGDLDSFCKEWDVDCPRAVQRLRIGIPATLEQGTTHHKPQQQGESTDATLVMNATEDFITLLDALKLGLTEKDTLHPYLVDVVQGVNKVTDKDFDSKAKMVQWLITLNQMRASEKLSDEQTRDFLFDMEQAYHGFKGTFKKD